MSQRSSSCADLHGCDWLLRLNCRPIILFLLARVWSPRYFDPRPLRPVLLCSLLGTRTGALNYPGSRSRHRAES